MDEIDPASLEDIEKKKVTQSFSIFKILLNNFFVYVINVIAKYNLNLH